MRKHRVSIRQNLPGAMRMLAILVMVSLWTAGNPQTLHAEGSSPAAAATKAEGDWIQITSKRSLANLESIDSYGITEQGTKAARLMLSFLETGSTSDLKAARSIYTSIIPTENFGGDYTALQWFSDYFLGDNNMQQRLISDPFHKSFFQFLTQDNNARLREYLQRKYHLKEFSDAESEAGRTRLAFLEDFILFNNPRRESWEKTSMILNHMNIRKGDVIADIGSGPGYYSFLFADRVGDTGQVYAIDTVKAHLNYLDSVARRNDIRTITTINNHNETLGLAPDQKVDLAFMCSLYHIIYIVYREAAREKFIDSVRSALKPDGRLVIVDNSVVDGADRPYHGPYIAKELIVAQLRHYGFQLDSVYQHLPQRYVLTFRLNRQS